MGGGRGASALPDAPNAKSRPKAAFANRAETRLLGGRSGSSSARGSHGGAGSSVGGTSGRSGSSASVGSGGSRGGGRSRGGGGSRGRSRRRLFLLAASGQRCGCNQGRQNERFLHFRIPFMGEKKQFPEIVRAAGMAALTEQQGLELLLFSPKLYAEKNNAGNPRLPPPAELLTSPVCGRETRGSFLPATREDFPAWRCGVPARCR
jgi:hypothetical protein